MAENQDERSSEDLSDEASPYRLEEMRKRGQVAQSKELSGLLALLAAGVATYALSPKIGTDVIGFMREVFQADLSSKMDLSSATVVGSLFTKALKLMLVIGLPISLAGFAIGALGSFMQIGSIFSTEPLTPDLNKINPIKGLQRIFSMKQLIDGLRMTVKTIILAFIAYLIIKAEIFQSPGHIGEEAGTLLGSYGRAARVMFLSLCGVLLVFALLDFAHQRWDYLKQAKLTKQEAKQEHKEREGDPQIKARIRSVQREMARKRMMAAVKTADVIITNPTHIAIAIIYDRANMAAPKVVAKGADFLAQRIKKIASDAGVPLVENVPLARTLYKTVKVNQYIPRALYQAVAEVLAYVYRLKNRRL